MLRLKGLTYLYLSWKWAFKQLKTDLESEEDVGPLIEKNLEMNEWRLTLHPRCTLDPY